MGWVGPNNWARLGQKERLDRPRPKRRLGRSWPNQKFLFSQGQPQPRRARLGQHRAGPATEAQRGRIIFLPPSPPACKTIMYAGGKRLQLKCRGKEDFTWRGGRGRWWCCGGGRWRCRGSRIEAPGCVAAVSNGGG